MRKTVSKGNSMHPRCKTDSTLSTTESQGVQLRECASRRRKVTDGILLNAEGLPDDDALIQLRRRARKEATKGGVKMGFVEIYEHAIRTGDNPGGIRGPALTIEWEAQNKLKLPILDYENDRPPRRSGGQMNIPPNVREEMLRNAGFSRGEIQEATRSVNIARGRRKRTIEIMNLSPFHEFTEKMFRGSRNLTIYRGKKKAERTYLKRSWELHCQLQELNLESRRSIESIDYQDEGKSQEMNTSLGYA